jgi:NAD(P)-dependent dehydrogenase (short-subunit alcohol dehydrogenase family)
MHKTPLGVPWIDPDDVAPAFVYLASDDAHTVTGSALDVTGGTVRKNGVMRGRRSATFIRKERERWNR